MSVEGRFEAVARKRSGGCELLFYRMYSMSHASVFFMSLAGARRAGVYTRTLHAVSSGEQRTRGQRGTKSRRNGSIVPSSL